MIQRYVDKISDYFHDQAQEQVKGEAIVRTYSGEETWVASAAYIPFISAAVLILRKNNSEFVSFHARQALVILIIIIFLLLLLPVVLKIIVAIAAYGLLVYGAYQAIRGKKWYLPVITELANTIEL